MENVHKPHKRQWISEAVNVKKFRDDWISELEDFPKRSEENLSLALNEITGESLDITELEEICGDEALECSDEDLIECVKTFEIPENLDLTTLRLQKEDLDRRNVDQRYRQMVYSSAQYYNYPPSVALGKQAATYKEFKAVAMPEVLLSIQMFRPETAAFKFQKKPPSRTPYFTIDQELCVLGEQYLTALRDVINCVADNAVPGDFSECPRMKPSIKCKDLYHSGFFYINGTFYNDMRENGNLDYSLPILKWASESGRDIGPFSSAKMEETKFVDLEVQLGYPYVYLHQGYCEHLMVFSDIRMLSKDDSMNFNDYPVYQTLMPKKRSFCMVCHIHTTKWVVFKNNRLPEDPFFFCEECFFAFNYDENGLKIGDFKAYHYCDRTALL